MNQNLKISEFARLSGITRKNLIFYDEIGLLSPDHVEVNGYRLYSYRQLETVSVISALREIGMSLKDIKLYLDERTPETLLDLFTLQRRHIDEKILKLQSIRRMIEMRLDITKQGLETDISKLILRKCNKEPLFASEMIEYNSDNATEKSMEDLYERYERDHMTYGYPLGTIVSREHLIHGYFEKPSRFFFKFSQEETKNPLVYKPAGLYLIGFEEINLYDVPLKIYHRMFDYIKKFDLEIAGDSYEEYLLDEIAIKEPGKHLLKISLQVEKKDH